MSRRANRSQRCQRSSSKKWPAHHKFFEALEYRLALNSAPVAFGDAYTVNLNTTLHVQDPTNVPAGTSYSGLYETQSINTNFDVAEIEYSEPYHVLFLRQDTSRIHIIDAATQAIIGTYDARAEFTDFDLTPDGRYLFVADYDRRGFQSNFNWVHRFDIETRQWDVRRAMSFAYRIEAVNESQVLVLEQDQSVRMHLYLFHDVELIRQAVIPAGRTGDIEYDHRSDRVFHGGGGNSQEIHAFQVGPTSLQAAETTGVRGTAEGYGGTTVLSSDGRYLFFGRLQVLTADVRVNVRALDESIIAAVGGIAFSTSDFYSVTTGERLGSLPYLASQIAGFRDATEVWAFDPLSRRLHDYRIPQYGSGVLANDTDVDSDLLTAIVVTAPTHGALTLDPDGTFSYTPTTGYTGVDSFSYHTSDGLLTSSPATVLLRINAPPHAIDDSYSVDEEMPLSVSQSLGVLLNDQDPEAAVLSAEVVTPPANGQLSLSANGSFTYVPNPDFSGVDVFTYRAADGFSSSNTATVRIVVRGLTDAPIASDDHYGVRSEQTLVIEPGHGVLANDSDQDRDILSAILVTGPIHGQLTLQPDGSFDYRADPGFIGLDTFSYQSRDAALVSSVATVRIFVQPQNDAPVPAPDDYAVGIGGTLVVGSSEVSAASFLGLAQTDILPFNSNVEQLRFSPTYQLLFVRAATGKIHVFDSQTLTEIEQHSPSAQFTDMDLAPDEHYLYVADFPGQFSGTGNIKPPHWVHRFDLLARRWEIKEAPDVAFHLEAIDAERFALIGPSGFDLTLNSFGDDPIEPIVELDRERANTHGDIEYSEFSGLLYNPDIGSSLKDIKIFEVVGGTLDRREGAFNPSQLGGGSAILSNDGKYLFYGPLQVLAQDVRVNVRVLPEIIYASGGGVAYGKNAYYSADTGESLGYFDFVSTAYDASQNGEHVWAYDEQRGTLRHYTLRGTRTGVLANDVDSDRDALTAVLVSPTNHGDLTFSDNGSFTYIPATGFVGTDTFIYRASDGYAMSEPMIVIIQVTANAAVNDQYVVHEDSMLTVSAQQGLLQNDVINTGPASIALTATPMHGQLTLNPDGTFAYLPDPGFTGIDRFAYRLESTGSFSEPAEVRVLVNAIDDPPKNTVPNDLRASRTITVPTAISLAGFRVDDPDTGGFFRVGLRADTGRLFFDEPPTSAWQSTASIDMYGTLATINDALARLRYEPSFGVFGEVRLEIFSNYLENPTEGDDDWTVIHVFDTPFRNPQLPFDVDGDGTVAALDVLLIVNDLNEHGIRDLLPEAPLPASPSNRRAPYYDVSGDNFLSALDVLLVVNYMNAAPNQSQERMSAFAAADAAVTALYGQLLSTAAVSTCDDAAVEEVEGMRALGAYEGCLDQELLGNPLDPIKRSARTRKVDDSLDPSGR